MHLVPALVLGGVVFWAICVALYARGLLSPPRMTDGKALARLGRVSPADLGPDGWPFEAISFVSREGSGAEGGAGGVQLAGWRVPAPSGSRRKVAVVVRGYADAKVGALAWGPVLRSLDYELVLFDLRAHGESGGTVVTGGLREADDLAAVVSAVTAGRGAPEEMLIVGASMGAAAVSRFVSEEGYTRLLRWRVAGGEEVGREGVGERGNEGGTEGGNEGGNEGGVRAVVLDSPVPDFLRGAVANARLLGLPGAWVIVPAVWLAERVLGLRFAEAAVTRTLPAARVPALVILPARDSYLTPAGRAELERAFELHRGRHPGARLFAPDTGHLLAVNTHPEAYREKVREVAG